MTGAFDPEERVRETLPCTSGTARGTSLGPGGSILASDAGVPHDPDPGARPRSGWYFTAALGLQLN